MQAQSHEQHPDVLLHHLFLLLRVLAASVRPSAVEDEGVCVLNVGQGFSSTHPAHHAHPHTELHRSVGVNKPGLLILTFLSLGINACMTLIDGD